MRDLVDANDEREHVQRFGFLVFRAARRRSSVAVVHLDGAVGVTMSLQHTLRLPLFQHLNVIVVLYAC